MKNTPAGILIFSLLSMGMQLYADDTDVFSGATIDVPPNVLIIFDSSGTMNDSIHQEVYDPAHDYSADLQAMNKTSSALTGSIIYYISGYTGGGHENPVYSTFPPPASKKDAVPVPLQVNGTYCATVKTALTSSGWWMGNINITSPYDCSGNTLYKLYSGNYVNFLTWLANGGGGSGSEAKIVTAQRIISELLDSIDVNAVRFGVMIYNRTQQGQGGEVIAPVGSTHQYVKDQIAAEVLARKSQLVSDTPLAECLAEAGLYYAGKRSWSSNVETPPYTSPVQYRCQKNYVILMTDGLSTSDQGVNNRHHDIIFNRNTLSGGTLTEYFNKAIGNYDQDKNADGTDVDPKTDSFGGTHWLDDVAKFIYEEDLLKSTNDSAGKSFDDVYFPKQFVTTYAIGFDSATDFSFLSRVTDSSHGRGTYFTARDSSQLSVAFQKILGMILAANSSFIAPVVPVNKLNKVYSGNSVYLSLFKPDATEPFWKGNIKKFGLSTSGLLLQKNGTMATDTSGQILSTATSCWSYSDTDGSVTEKGGAGAVLLNQGTRHFYTNKGTNANLTDASNIFSSANADVKTALAVTDPDDLIAYLTATGNYASTGSLKRDWVLGDILHSKPVTMFDNDNTIMFVGSNDGFLHAFVDNDNHSTENLSDDTLTEAWCFVPWDLLPNLHLIRDGSFHPYFVDGSPVIYDDGGYRYVSFGLRRGGSKYYTLRVGQVDGNGNYTTGGYTSPVFSWDVAPNILGTGSETLGQSWSRPVVSMVKSGPNTVNRVLLLAGGYDAANEDRDVPDVSDSVGRAIFAVDAGTGALQTNLNFNHSNYPEMTHSFTEVVAFDHNSNGIDDTIYAASLGGDVFAFNDRDEDGTWSKVKVFQARSADAGTQNMLLKFFYEPDIAMETFGDYVFMGTGDREHPSNTATVNRLYAIKNTWASSWTTPTEANLVDVTNYQYTATALTNLQTGKGWFIRLDERAGEKVVSSPLLYNGIVFFTTYTPEPSNSTVDKCSVEGLGGGRLYALDYLTGKAAMNFNTANDTNGEVLDRTDRYMSLGVGIPSPPTLVVTKDGGAMLIIGTGGAGGTTGAETISIPSSGKAKMYYWKQK